MESTLWTVQTPAGEVFAPAVAADPQGALLAFDFDGTLAHMSLDPEDVSLTPASAAAIDRLAQAGIQIAIVSGRPVESIERLARVSERTGLGNAVLLGQYGTERLDVATAERRDPPVPPGMTQAHSDLSELLAGIPGTFVENKGRAIVAHTRRCAAPEAVLAELEEPLRDLAARHGLIVEPGRLVWELRSSSVTKGDALWELIQEFEPTAVLMAGDDRGDIAAFDALSEYANAEGSSVSVCAAVSKSAEQPALARRADVLCDGPDGVSAWLTFLADAVEGHQVSTDMRNGPAPAIASELDPSAGSAISGTKMRDREPWTP